MLVMFNYYKTVVSFGHLTFSVCYSEYINKSLQFDLSVIDSSDIRFV